MPGHHKKASAPGGSQRQLRVACSRMSRSLSNTSSPLRDGDPLDPFSGMNDGKKGVTGEFMSRNETGRNRSDAGCEDAGCKKSLSLADKLSAREIESLSESPCGARQVEKVFPEFS